jgi:two-component system, NarL family, nitrate/nitrite response regulator NarL
MLIIGDILLERKQNLLTVQPPKREPCLTSNQPRSRSPIAGALEGAGDTFRGGVIVNIVVLTPTRLLGDGLSACLNDCADVVVSAVVSNLAGLRETLGNVIADLVLIDVTQGIDLYDVRSLALDHPGVALVALGLSEQRQDVIRCGRAGFTGYVARNASIDGLRAALVDVMAGRLACPAEVSSSLLRALFRREGASEIDSVGQILTRRESEVLRLLGRGLSNKEIARELSVSVATVKHHVHHVLEKLGLHRRGEAIRRIQDEPWLVSSSDQDRR